MDEIKSINYTDDMHCISRIDQRKFQNGKHRTFQTWFVRIKSKSKTKRWVKSFSDKKYGGEYNALLEAKKYRDDILKSSEFAVRQIASLPNNLKVYDVDKRLSLRKACGQNVFELGSGIDAALKAKEMGASRFIVNKIYLGKGQTYRPCYRIPKFEVYGFRNAASITKALDSKIRRMVRMKTSNPDIIDLVVQKTLLAYASLDMVKKPIFNEDALLNSLVTKYFKAEITAIYRRKNKTRTIDPSILDSLSCDVLQNLDCFNGQGMERNAVDN